jgi:hypothetical protein
MKRPFSELMDFQLRAFDEIAPLDPNLFMGGSTPRLRYLLLQGIPFPGLPKLLLSATHLVSLRLYDIPHSGYISPEAMVTCLSMLTRLEQLCLAYLSLQSHVESQWQGRRLPLPIRSVLPALVDFYFRGPGDSDYLEDLTSRVDAPRLKHVSIDFTDETAFDNAQLFQFIGRTPALKASDKAHVIFGNGAESVTLSSNDASSSRPGQFNVEISCEALGRQLSALAKVCNLTRALPLDTVEDLYIHEKAGSRLNWDYYPTENEEWLGLLKPFASVKHLYLSDYLKQSIAPALLVWDGVVLPALKGIFLEVPRLLGPQAHEEGIGQFMSPAHFPNLYPESHGLWPWNQNPSWPDHEQNHTAPTPQLSLPMDRPQPSGFLPQEDTWQFTSPQQPDSDPQNLRLPVDLIQPSVDWVQPSEPLQALLHGDSRQHSSAAQPPTTLQNPYYSVDSQLALPSEPVQVKESDWPDSDSALQNLHHDPGPYWSQQQPPGLQVFHQGSDFQYSLPGSSVQLESSAMQVIDAQDPQQSGREPQELEGRWPAPAQNFHLDGSHWQWQWQPSGLSSRWEHWEECIRRFAAARQETGRPITISFWDRKNERVERSN